MANPNKDSVDLAKDEALRQRKGGQAKQMILWFAALIVGAILGWLQVPALNELFNFVATVFTRLFQFIAVPTIALAVITTLSALGAKKDTGRIFAHAVTYTLLTTIAAASIVAKVTRDRYMENMSKTYPQYDFEHNMGYGTTKHIAALKEFGATPIHRRSFIGNFVK